jgi:protein tyrosine phosphatase type 4A
LNLITTFFDPKKQSSSSEGKGCIAVHCVAGLGRTPVLIAIALMEKGMTSEDAVTFIRKHRKGAINRKQLEWLEHYQPPSAKGCCIIL